MKPPFISTPTPPPERSMAEAAAYDANREAMGASSSATGTGPGTGADAYEVMLRGLMDKVEELQATVVNLTTKLAAHDDAGTRPVGRPAAERQRPPTMNVKDVEKPSKYKGQR